MDLSGDLGYRIYDEDIGDTSVDNSTEAFGTNPAAIPLDQFSTTNAIRYEPTSEYPFSRQYLRPAAYSTNDSLASNASNVGVEGCTGSSAFIEDPARTVYLEPEPLAGASFQACVDFDRQSASWELSRNHFHSLGATHRNVATDFVPQCNWTGERNETTSEVRSRQ